MTEDFSAKQRVFHAGLTARPASRNKIRRITCAIASARYEFFNPCVFSQRNGINAPRGNGWDARIEQDVEAARHVIDTLTMLQQKTKGNPTDQEKLLSTVLYDLQLKCVQKSS